MEDWNASVSSGATSAITVESKTGHIVLMQRFDNLQHFSTTEFSHPKFETP
jgi:hypothetical protein